tara:strand:+ start:249 stop:632 length:384 start_codon:yes stop_codon:yes gene_type:complete
MKRKLKPTHKRKPEESVSHNDILIMVARETGFTRNDIGTVIDTWLTILRKELLERKSVKLRKLGTLFPMVQPPRRVTNMGGNDIHNYEDMIMNARWQIKFQTDSELINDVQDIMVTKRDLDKIYYKE